MEYSKGKKTVEEINRSNKPTLLVEEINVLEDYLIEELDMGREEFEHLKNQFDKIIKNKKMFKSLEKIVFNKF